MTTESRPDTLARRGIDVQAWAMLTQIALASPVASGVVYWHFDAAGRVLYIGSASHRRYGDRQREHARMSRWWGYVARVEHRLYADRSAAFNAERAAIEQQSPVFNPPSLAPTARARILSSREGAYRAEHGLPFVEPPEKHKGRRTKQITRMLEEVGVYAPPLS